MSQKGFWERLPQADKQVSLSKDHGEFKEAQSHQNCDNWQKKKSPSARTKLPHSKLVFRESTSNKNKQNKSNNEQVSVSGSANVVYE